MKRTYEKPVLTVVRIAQSEMICQTSVLGPGEPNQPAGTRDTGSWANDYGFEE